jgi:hypothetical protein
MQRGVILGLFVSLVVVFLFVSGDVFASSQKVSLCHGDIVIEVAERAVEAHLDHGDSLGPCSQNTAEPNGNGWGYGRDKGGIPVYDCRAIEDSGRYVLDGDVENASNCFRLAADDIEIDCKGHSITYGTSEQGQGVVGFNQNNLTVRNCFIQDLNELHSSGVGVNFTTVSNSFILNNSIVTNGTSKNYGIALFSNVYNNTIAGNYVDSNGNEDHNYGIILVFNGTGNIVSNNSVATKGRDWNYGVAMFDSLNGNLVESNTIHSNGRTENFGIYLFEHVLHNIISSNSVATSGHKLNAGIRLQKRAKNSLIMDNQVTTNNGTGIEAFDFSSYNSIVGNLVLPTGFGLSKGIDIGSSHNILSSNTIVSSSGAQGSHGIRLNAGSIQVVNNTVSSTGAGNDGVFISGTQKPIVLSSNILTSIGLESYALSIHNSVAVNVSDTIFSNPTEWVSMDSKSDVTFSNITFSTIHGNLRFPETFALQLPFEVTHSGLDIDFNRTFVDTSVLDFLNRTAIISLFGITSDDPQPVVDLNDDGTFVDCGFGTDPICEELSRVDDVFVFNVTHFTTYAVSGD